MYKEMLRKKNDYGKLTQINSSLCLATKLFAACLALIVMHITLRREVIRQKERGRAVAHPLVCCV